MASESREGRKGQALTRPRTPRYLVVSPHLDDAVFSCASLLAARPGTIVCTIFAGTPKIPQRTGWDDAAGFVDSTQAMQGRLREDKLALDVCGAHAIRLDFLDGQYGPLPDADTLAAALGDELERLPDLELVVPLGLRHPDHVRVAEAWGILFRARRLKSCVVYEEAIHRTARGAAAARLAELGAAGLCAHPLDETWLPERLGARALDVKRRSVRAYASQLRAFGERLPADIAKPERYWRLGWASTASALRALRRNGATADGART